MRLALSGNMVVLFLLLVVFGISKKTYGDKVKEVLEINEWFEINCPGIAVT